MKQLSELNLRDQRLSDCLAQLAEQQREGLAPDLDGLIQQNPDLGEELRSLWATAQFANRFVPKAFIQPEEKQKTLSSEGARSNPFPSQIGDYELIRELGRGGMGVVYLALQKSLNRMVALKLMRDARLASDLDRHRFRAEASSTARLKHPNIVTVHEVNEWDGQPYIVMEYVKGLTLGQLLTKGPLSNRESAGVISQIARAIHHAHEAGILHRDLKPNNILVADPTIETSVSRESSPTIRSTIDLNPKIPTEIVEPTKMETIQLASAQIQNRPISNRVLKITDFGLAKQLVVDPTEHPDPRTISGQVIGTPSYMSPEQATGRKSLGPASDVYSVGAILYELLTGRPPFQAANPVDTILMVIEQEPVPPRWLDPGVDRELETICLKALQKLPHLRYNSANELANDLDAFLQGDYLSTRPGGIRYFFARMMRETHHIGVLENWGLIWIWHSLTTFLLCLLTQILAWNSVTNHLAYLALWTTGLITWGAVLWQWRSRAGSILFVERSIAHAWAAGVCSCIAMFVIETVVPLPALTLSPAIAVTGGMVFVFKAGILSGRFYLTAGAMFLTSFVMPLVHHFEILLLGVATALSFLIPGIKYYRLRRQSLKNDPLSNPSSLKH